MAAKRGRGKSKGRKVAPSLQPRAAAESVLGSPGGDHPTSNDLWSDLRQGARNVAGVRYQLAVTAHVLAESRDGSLPFVEVVPEGYEDIDCLDRESNQWLIQVKEVGAGAGRFTAASVAEVLSHAATAAHEESTRIVAVTDAQLGGQVAESGWSRTIAETPGYDLESTVNGLVGRGHSRAEAEALLRRAHLVVLPWNVTPRTSLTVAGCFGLTPAVAALAVSRLVEDLASVAGDQRLATPDNAGRRVLNDLDALVERVLSVVDVEALGSAVSLGVCEIADYAANPASNRRDFLVGVDAAPAHVGANYDIIRPEPSRAVQVGLETARYCLIAGPSGAGKSTQMWRAARDVAPGARVLRVLRLATQADVNELLRHVQLLAPSEASPVMVCCDDLGRPATVGWPGAARRLLELPDVLLIGAVRQEDFTPDLLRHGGELVQLRLDESTANAISEQLRFAGVEMELEISEAVQLADGQLMEYVSLLTTGRRMRAVLADQADSLLRSDNPAAAAVARLICAAHVLGVPVDAATLGAAAGLETTQLTHALRRLQDEHIVVSESGSMWRGLHQRRSDVLTELLHATPPPDLPSTLAAVLRLLTPSALGWALRRTTELFPDLQPAYAEPIASAAARCGSAVELAGLIEGLERADHSLTARAFIPILDRYRQPSVPLSAISMLVCGDKLAGIRFGSDGDGLLSSLGERVHRCAEELPDRSTTFADSAVSAFGTSLVDFIVDASAEDAVRLLEAVALYVQMPVEDLQRIAGAFPWPLGTPSREERALHGRLHAACRLLASGPMDFSAAFGDLPDRLQRAASSVPNVVFASLGTDVAPSASLRLLVAEDSADEAPQFDWDLDRRRSGSSDAISSAAVDVATFVGECCPELDVVEVRTILADGSVLKVGDFEPGHKRLARNGRPPREVVRINVGIQAAIARQAAAYSWTQLIRARERIAETLAALVGDAPRRLSSFDDQKRREQWTGDLEETVRALAELPRPPAAAEHDPVSAAARWDEQRDEDSMSAAFRSVADALRMLAPGTSGKIVHAGVGDSVRKAALKLEGALEDGGSLTTAVERVACRRLLTGLQLLRDVLAALSFDIQLAKRVSGRPEDLGGNLLSLVADAAARQMENERSELHELFREVDGSFVLEVPDPVPFLTSVVGHQWLVTVPPSSWDAIARVAAERRPVDISVSISIACRHGADLLPIAGRLSRSFDAGFVPLGADQLAELGAALGLSVVRGPALDTFGTIVQELARASWEFARSELRPAEWRSPDSDPLAHWEHAESLGRELDANGLLSGVVEELLERVRAEIEGQSGAVPFAAELATATQSDFVQVHDGLALVSSGVLAAIDVELGRAIAE